MFCEARHGSLAAAPLGVLHPALTPLHVPQGEADKRKPGALRPQEEPGVEIPAVVSPGYGMWNRAGAPSDPSLLFGVPGVPASMGAGLGGQVDWAGEQG